MKKLIMTVLTLALILGSISVASAASGKVRLTDIADNANEEAIQVTYDLEIVTGTPEGGYEPDKAINRAEFAALVSRALKVPDSALASYTSTTFKDTSGYGWAVPYLAYCQQKGIMKGDGYGNAMPGRTINPNEAVTMILRAIGYTDNASVLVGQWPANYVALGQNHNLYENVSNDVEMNKAAAAQMIYNALTVQLVQVDANSLVTLLYDSDAAGFAKTMLTTYLNCYQDMSGADDRGRKIVSYSDAASSKINLIPKVGAYGILYRSNVDREVVALTEVETVFLSGKFTYAGADRGEINKFKAVDGTEYNLSPEAKTVVNRIAAGNAYTTGAGVGIYERFINGNDSSTVELANNTWRTVGDYVTKYFQNKYTTATNPPADFNIENASKLIVSAKVSGVTVLDLRSVAVWDAELPGYGDSFLYQSGQIDGKKFNGHDLPLDLSNEVDDYGYVLAGANDLADLTANNVVYIYKNADKKIKRIEVGTETQSGTITNINSKNGQRTIGGKVLNDSPYHGSGWADLDNINNEGTALLDIYGRTFAFQLGEASKGNFAVWVAYGTTGFGDAQHKLFDKTGAEVIYGQTGTLYDSVNPNDDHYYPGSDNYTFPTGASQPISRLIEYKLSGGKLSEVSVGTLTPGLAYIGTSSNYGKVNAAGTILTVKLGAADKDYLIDSGVLVYVADIPQGKTILDADFSIGSIKDLQDGAIANTFQYILKDGKVKALLINSDDAGAQNEFVMINSITRGSDGAGGEIDVVNGVGFKDGVNAGGKTWNYTNNGLISKLTAATGITSTPNDRGRYSTIVKFRIGEDGVLKEGTVLRGSNAENSLYLDVRYLNWSDGSGGTFTVEYDTRATGDSATTSGAFVAFEADTVLYKVDAGNWTAMRPSESNFKADEGAGRYDFLKSDPEKKAYDIIIKR
jgi:hypothetical protein